MHPFPFRRYLLDSCKCVIKNVQSTAHKMHSTSKKPFTITVEGNIGSGKTKFLDNFNNSKNVLTIPEPVEAWKNVGGHNLLSLLYSDLKTWAFTFQSYVQVTTMKSHEQKTDKPVKIAERSLYSSRYVFVENLLQMDILRPPEVAVLDEWFNWLVQKENFSVDLIVYLRTDPEVCYQRILERSRKGEEHISFDYLVKLHECHENWLNKKTKFSLPAPVLTLDANKNLNDIKEEYSHFQNHVESLSSYELP